MQNIFSLLKNKKLFFIIFLGFFVCSGLLCTSQVFAAFSNDAFPGAAALNAANPNNQGADTNYSPCTDGSGNTITSASGWCNSADQIKIKDALVHTADSNTMASLSATDFWKAIPDGIGYFFINLTYYISAISSLILSYVIGTIVSIAITTNTNFTPAWAQMRNLGDMLIVLGFVVVGIATSLRIRTYEANKLLFPLILAAFLINFSSLFCGLIIDAANLVTMGLTTASSSGSTGTASSVGMMSRNILESVRVVSEAQTRAIGSSVNEWKWMLVCLEFAVVYCGIAFTFLYLSCILIARYVVLTMLYILSPLAFALWIFPASKKLWTEWWNHFIKWCFIGVFGSFTLWVASVVMSTQNGFKATGTTGAIAATDPGALWQITISCVIVLAFLVIGFKMTAQKTGIAAMAGAAIMGLATGGAGMALGAVGAVGKGGVKKLDEKLIGGRGAAAVQSISNSTGRFMERVGMRDTGTTAAKNSKKVDEKASLLSKEYTTAKATGDTASMERIQAQAKNGRGVQGAAAMKVIADAKDVGTTFGNSDTGLQLASNRMANAEAYGATGIRSAAEKLDPRLAGFNKQAIAKHGSANAAIANAYSRAATPDIENFSEEVLKNPAFIENTSAKKIEKSAERMSTAQTNALKTHLHPNSYLSTRIIQTGGRDQKLIDKNDTIQAL